MLNRDFIFEFAGMPKSGKTTVLDTVVHYLKRQNFKVEEYHGGGRYAPIDKSAIASLNMLLACKAVEFVLAASEREKVQYKIFLMDRGVIDRYIFTTALLEMDKIDEPEAQAILNFLRISRLMTQVDGVFLFMTNSEISISREYKNKLVEKPGRVMNTDFLETLRRVSLRELQGFQRDFGNITLVDTEENDGKILECAQQVVDKITKIIEAK